MQLRRRAIADQVHKAGIVAGAPAAKIASPNIEAEGVALVSRRPDSVTGKNAERTTSLSLAAVASLAIEARRLFLSRSPPIGTLGNSLKCFASEMCYDVVNMGLQVFAGYGYSREYPLEKLLRDARIYSIFEGTNQVQRQVIGKTLLG